MVRRSSLVLTLVLVAATVVPTIAVAAPSDLLLTQYIEGSSFNKALEVGNTTGGDIDLDDGGYHLVGYHNGNTSPTYEVALTGTLEDGGAWVLADTQASQPLQDVADHTRSGLWNGNDALVLYRDYDPATDGGTVLDSVGQVGDEANWGRDVTLCPIDGRESGDSTPNDAFDADDAWTDLPQDTVDGMGDPAACGNGAGGGEESEACEPDTLVHELNTVGDDGLPDTDRFGADVAVEGIVTANFLPGLDGVFVQEEDADADGDDSTSEGIFVYLPGSGDDALAVGDVVCVSGTVGEFHGTYQLNSAEFEVRDSDVELPDAVEVELPVERTKLAQRAGMRIVLSGEQGLTITQNFFLGRFGELDLSGSGFLWHPGELFDPGGAEAANLRQANLDAMIKLDDANSTQNPTPTPWLANGDVRAGSEATGPITGITHYQHDAFRVQPTHPEAVEFVNEGNPRPDDAPDVLEGANDRTATATVASFNVLNYFTTFRSRGAFNGAEFERQAQKIVTAITEMDADVVGLMEIENNFGSDRDALLDLVDRLNAADTPSTWAAVDLDAPVGTDEISNAMIYRKHRVTPVGDPAIADHEAFVNPLGGDTDRNRPAIAQAFRVRSGHIFVAVVNHLKSKGSSCEEDGDPGHPIAGNCNLTRTEGAEELVRWLKDDDPTGTGSDAVAVIGDLNAYAMEAPVRTLIDAGYVDPFSDRLTYSFTFDGEHGRLDHGLLSHSLAEHLVDAAIWHINTDEPAAFDYKGWNDPANQDDSEFRSSDHDPVLLGLQFTRQGAGCRDHRPGPHAGGSRPGCPG